MLKWCALLIAALSGLAFATAPGEPAGLRTPASFNGIKDDAVRSRALFAEVSKVIQSPRCLNCHPATRAPLQGNDGRPHSPPVREAGMSLALTCRTCHHNENTETFAGGVQSIPGDPAWALAPATMAWVGKSSGEICRQLKDPARNGDRDLAAIQKHMAEDHLVGWGWHPGLGRTPAPGTQSQFGALVGEWIRTGAQCPAR